MSTPDTGAPRYPLLWNGCFINPGECLRDSRDGSWIVCTGADVATNVYLGLRYPPESKRCGNHVYGDGEAVILTLDEMKKWLKL